MIMADVLARFPFFTKFKVRRTRLFTRRHCTVILWSCACQSPLSQSYAVISSKTVIRNVKEVIKNHCKLLMPRLLLLVCPKYVIRAVDFVRKCTGKICPKSRNFLGIGKYDNTLLVRQGVSAN